MHLVTERQALEAIVSEAATTLRLHAGSASLVAAPHPSPLPARGERGLGGAFGEVVP